MNSIENAFIDNSNVDQTTICNTYKVNMKPLKLDDSSTKKEPDFGDVLYIIKKAIFSFFIIILYLFLYLCISSQVILLILLNYYYYNNEILYYVQS